MLGEVNAEPASPLTHGHYVERLPRKQAYLCLDEDWEEAIGMALWGARTVRS